MGNHIQDVLAHWYPLRDRCRWVLGTVVATEGSSYRKPGAMMMFNEKGEFFGLLSGGCLEKALFTDVKKVLSHNRAREVEFDSTADTDVAWQLGLGCGGKVQILLQPVAADNQYQQLCELIHALDARQKIQYWVSLNTASTASGPLNRINYFAQSNQLNAQNSPSNSSHADTDQLINALWLPIALTPRRHLAIFGGGVDSVPLVQMAKTLGWQLSVIDHRVAYAQQQHFIGADTIIREQAQHIDVIKLLATVDAAFVMTHNVQLDASALSVLLPSRVQYIGLLGPVHRKHRVLVKAGLKPDRRIHGPMGLDLGGELPESIALAALAQCHQVLERPATQNSCVEKLELCR